MKYGKDTGRLFTDALPEEVQQIKPIETDQRTGFPKELLCGIAWSFRQQRYYSLAAFADELQAYNEEITGEYTPGVWTDELKLIGSRILVQYEHWDDELEESREEKVFLQADNGSYFTVTELIIRFIIMSVTNWSMMTMSSLRDCNCLKETMSIIQGPLIILYFKAVKAKR